MTQISVGGVPEHFNLPWLMAIENGKFADAGLDIIWKEYPGGTGAMCKDLRSENLDVAVILTEGIIRDIILGNPSVILQYYVRSPLIWGIHISPDAPYNSVRDLEGKRYAISRFGSGSHLMAYVHANTMGWKINKDQFVLSGGLHGAIKDINEGRADIFFWEKFTTRPFVNKGYFRLLDEFLTPWPCFVIAARREFADKDQAILKSMLDIVNESCANLKMDLNASDIIARRYHQEKGDVQTWLEQTNWAYNGEMNPDVFESVMENLFNLELLNKIYRLDDLIYSFSG